MNKDDQIKQAIEIYNKRLENERIKFAERILEIFSEDAQSQTYRKAKVVGK